jgi:hypothetical protein
VPGTKEQLKTIPQKIISEEINLIDGIVFGKRVKHFKNCSEALNPY